MTPPTKEESNGATRAMTLNLTGPENTMLREMAKDQDVTNTFIIRKALRLYFTMHTRLKAGQKMYFQEGEKKVEAIIL